MNRASLSPGDAVLFEGGQTFSDATLMPSTSGAAGAPITFGSYGSGQATISNAEGAVWFSGKNHLSFEDLRLTTDGGDSGIFAGSSVGSQAITVEHCTLENSPEAGVISPNPADSGWRIADSTISHVGDSGLIIEGSRATIVGNTITDTGWNPAIPYGKHGIYAKGPDITIADNDISHDTQGSAISLRFHGARVYGNAIHDTRDALTYFPDDPSNAGSVLIYGNRIWGIGEFALYYSGRTSAVGLVFANNTVSLAGAVEAVDVSEATSANVSLVNNVFTGSYGTSLDAPSPATGGSFTEHDNLWFGASGRAPSGTGDRYADPQLAAPPSLAPALTSPVVDAGSISVPGLILAPACDGAVLSYCGASPDIGAVESTVSPAPPASPSPAPTPTTRSSAGSSGSAGGHGSAGSGSGAGSAPSGSGTASGTAGSVKSGRAVAARAVTRVQKQVKAGGRGLSLEARSTRSRRVGKQIVDLVTFVVHPRTARHVRLVVFRLDGRPVCHKVKAPFACRLVIRRNVKHTLTVIARAGTGEADRSRVLLARMRTDGRGRPNLG